MTSSHNFQFCLHAFDSLVHVEGDDAEVFSALQKYIFPPVSRREPEQCSADIFLRVARTSAGFDVSMGHRLAASAITLDDAVLAAVKALDDAVVHRMKTFRAVHAGAVLFNQKALLFPGLTHAGKSSLVAELLRRGASCFSDEYALIDSEGRIHSYPRPLLLRNGGARQSLVLPEELNGDFAAGTAPVGWIFALDYVPGQAWAVHEMAQGEAVMLLLRNTPHEVAESPGMVDFFVAAAANAVCYSGRRCDVAEAATHVLNLVGGN